MYVCGTAGQTWRFGNMYDIYDYSSQTTPTYVNQAASLSIFPLWPEQFAAISFSLVSGPIHTFLFPPSFPHFFL